jgi:hypothetical protein
MHFTTDFFLATIFAAASAAAAPALVPRKPDNWEDDPFNPASFINCMPDSDADGCYFEKPVTPSFYIILMVNDSLSYSATAFESTTILFDGATMSGTTLTSIISPGEP